MPNSLNYGVLERNLQTYMLRTDQPFVDEIPYLIERGVIRVYNNAKDLGFEIKLRLNNVAAGTSTINKPGNWRETVSILMFDTATTTISYLLPRSREFAVTYWPYYNDQPRARPKYYSDNMTNVNNNQLNNTYAGAYWLLSPTCDVEYNFDIIYLGIPLFDVNNPVNFLTQRYPNLLLYSCLIEASIFLDNEDKRNKYQMMFEKELETINKMNTGRSADRTVIRDNN